MTTIKTDQPVGIVNSAYFHQHFSLQRFYPSSPLEAIVDHYWIVKWQLPDGEGYTQSVIPHPNTHLTFIENASHIQGICQTKYSHTMTGKGQVLGIKFKPAGFYPFAYKAGVAMSALVNQVEDIAKFFPTCSALKQIETTFLHSTIDEERLRELEYVMFTDVLSGQLSVNDKVNLVNQMVHRIETNKSIMSVNDLCALYQLDNRGLQRLFSQYVGVSAKWIINRFRIHDALTQVETNKQVDWTKLAVDLGYYDQAHFIKDFKALMGVTPKQHQAEILT